METLSGSMPGASVSRDDVYMCPECRDRWMTRVDDDRCEACVEAARGVAWFDVEEDGMDAGRA